MKHVIITEADVCCEYIESHVGDNEYDAFEEYLLLTNLETSLLHSLYSYYELTIMNKSSIVKGILSIETIDEKDCKEDIFYVSETLIKINRFKYNS